MSNTPPKSPSSMLAIQHVPEDSANSRAEPAGVDDPALEGKSRLSPGLVNRLKNWLLGRINKPAAQGLVFAGFWHRLLALVIDFPISLALALSIIMVVELVVPVKIPHLNTMGGNTLAMLSLQFIYFVVFESSPWKATPGKRLLKLRVTDLRGQRLSPLNAAARTIFKILDPFTLGFAVVWIFFSKKHQTLYDKFCNSLVLRKTNESFLPNRLKAWHWFIVVGLSLVLLLSTLRIVIQISLPRIDSITLILSINEALKKIEPAQKAVQEALRQDGKPPAGLDVTLISGSASVSYLYQASDGALSVLFNSGGLKGMQLILVPKMDVKKDVVWACAAVKMPESLTPKSCAVVPTPTTGVSRRF